VPPTVVRDLSVQELDILIAGIDKLNKEASQRG
jgi:hypothetical protein